MCGISGIINNSLSATERQKIMLDMLRAIAHRGPDGNGIYSDPDGKPIILGHQRLAIIDPEHGKQPMSSVDGMVTVIFNGAIYNYLELRRELLSLGHPLHSYSDTEVLLYSYIQWGEQCVEKFRGMFAFAIWDRRNQILFCARDRVGIKPFYYYFDGKQFIFASEIKAIIASSLVPRAVDAEGLQDYITFQFCLHEKTLFKNIKKLEPGHSLIATIHTNQINLAKKQYWDVNYAIDDHHNETYFIDHLAFLLEDSVSQHLRSDVPLGAHLSGGLDSTTVAALASSKLQNVPFKTFTGAFKEGIQFDETKYAKLVAEQTGSQYHEIYIPSEEFTTILPKLIYYMDEPAAGPGLIPQYYVSKLAAQHVKVVLGGQGGDELYIGYARYLVCYLEKCLHAAIYQTSDSNKYAVSLETIVPNLPLLQTYKPMLQHFWRENLFASDDKRYFRLIDRSEGSKQLFNSEIFENYCSFDDYQKIFNRKDLHSLINHMTYFDLKASLPALLHVEDRTSMAASLESRVPLLDHRLIEFIASIPPNIKFAKGQTKHIFREAVKNIVPTEIMQRQDKMGFPVPLNQWLKNTDSDFVSDILFSDRARQRGIYNMKEIETSLVNEGEFSRIVWGLLNLELWHRIYIDGDSSSYA